MTNRDAGKTLKTLAEKRALKNYLSGTGRLLVAGLSGLIGIVYLVLFISELVAGKIEIQPTEIAMAQIEANGFPAAQYLHIKDAYLIFPEASVKAKNRGTEFSYLAVPAVSQSLMEQWKFSIRQRGEIDASQFRLYVIFTGEQAENFWPSGVFSSEIKDRWAKTGGMMPLTGETGPARWSVFRKPMDSDWAKKNLDWNKVRYLKFEKHVYGPGRSIKHFIYSALLFALSFYALRRHLGQRGPIPDGTPDPLIFYEAPDSNDID